MEQKYFYAFLIFPLMLALRVAAHFLDKRRIKDEVEARRGRAISIIWNPFGRGWFFEKGERHYDVTYVDRRSGGTVTAACKTSMFTGVYWVDGETTAETPPRILSNHRCAKCGYSIRIEWRACPNCGKATEFA
ncbi:MAG: zinc ribbon domain-containing protein [Candidatus Binatota bacterium]|nr:zinc ribbon domain-containing protein [Candidatus Binatota bacterium]